MTQDEKTAALAQARVDFGLPPKHAWVPRVANKSQTQPSDATSIVAPSMFSYAKVANPSVASGAVRAPPLVPLPT